MTINERIEYAINILGLNPNSFSVALKVDSTIIHNIIKGRKSKPGYELLEKILNTFPISAEWLMREFGQPILANQQVDEDKFTFEELVNEIAEIQMKQAERIKLLTMIGTLRDRVNRDRRELGKILKDLTNQI